MNHVRREDFVTRAPRFRTAATLVVLVFVASVLSAANNYEALHKFSGGADGLYPWAGLISDAAGNLYGTTQMGGNQSCYNGCGTIFKLTHGADGKWSKTTLHRFNGRDGTYPFAGLIFDAVGNLYGTTSGGGDPKICGPGCGTVYRLSPGTKGQWVETVLHSFNGEDGQFPAAGLIFDSSGNLYGTTRDGGYYGCGTVFELVRRGSDKWTEIVLHTFDCKNGGLIYAGLVFDAKGSLYGTAANGGVYNDGTVFRLTKAANGKWIHTVLHSFDGKDGVGPTADLVFDEAGNLYGTTEEGGNLDYCYGYGCGTVFTLTSGAGDKWMERVLHNFNDGDGAYPNGRLVFDGTGNLYCTTTGDLNYGTVVKLASGGNGDWKETVLYRFTNTEHGSYPVGGVLLDATGNLYGTTTIGGDLTACSAYQGKGCGVAFEITP